jgi:nucleoside-diphosphate-sugar epimerase
MESDAALNQDFNLSTAVSTTVRELATMIWRKIRGDEPLTFEFLPSFQYDVQFRIPDTSKARRLLGFEATTPLDQVLDEVIDWLWGNLGGVE